MPEKPSLTAEMVALVRAREQARPPEARVVDDPFAGRFLELAGSRLTRGGGANGPLAVTADLAFKLPFVGFSGLVLARHRLMDDFLLGETAAGARQCVILGAGYDARAYRFPPPAGAMPGGTEGAGLAAGGTSARKPAGPARFFEVDHPTLSSRKRDLAAAVAAPGGAGAPPLHVTYVAVDFLRQRLSDRLLAEGFDPSARTVFIWEGVTYYLTPEAVRGTLETVRSLAAPGSAIVFDAWARPPGVSGVLIDASRLAARVLGAAIAEPFLFFLAGPEEAEALLRETGYDPLFTRGASDLRAILRARGRTLLLVPPHVVVAAGRVA